MILNDRGIVLWRRNVGEFDRVAALLTENHGRLFVRFGGVNRPAGKLKALSEPMTSAEYRLCFSPRSDSVRVIGGRLESVFCGIRADLARTLQALSCCEMAMRLVPERAAGPDKYQLLACALQALDAGESPWIEAAFGLKLLEACGYALRELPVPPSERELWRALHDVPLDRLVGLPCPAPAVRRFLRVVQDHVEAHGQKALRAGAAMSRLESFSLSLKKEAIAC